MSTTQTTAPAIDVPELYAWLGRQAEQCRAEVNELAINLDESAGPDYMADAFVQVRRHMRHLDPSLPTEPIDHL